MTPWLNSYSTISMARAFNIYERQRAGKFIFLAISSAAIIIFLLISNSLIKELGKQERERMKIWAKATQRLAQTDFDGDYEFLLEIIQQNNSIPVLVADNNLNILDYRNFKLPDKKDSPDLPYSELSERNKTFLQKTLKKAVGNQRMAQLAKTNPHFIEVAGMGNAPQYIYYEDSILLKRLSLYPYIQMVVMIILAVIIYVAVIYTKRAEQNRVWAGLSKETAHQLGTPISSLMAWNEYLAATGTDKEITDEIDKDVKRLSIIAERFSKVGSIPELKPEMLNDAVAQATQYMKSRLSGKVNIELNVTDSDHPVMLSRQLFEWVMENLIKNAVDAMKGDGALTITTGEAKDHVWVEVKDTGKGIARKNFKTVFNPGYTTKKRGWGLGLALAKRIMEEYHGGKIYVKDSEPGKGTTFRIEIPIPG